MTEALPKMYCYNHPNVETTLRCNHCERPICAKCAVLTPTGYRCKECVRGQQKVFETAQWVDYPLVFAVVTILAFLSSLVAFRLSFFVILIAPIAGGVLAEIARLVTRKHRSRRLFILAGVAAIAGCIPIALQFITPIILMPLIWHVVYTVMMTSTFFYRLSGIRIG
jgi:hypothetical protein